MSSDARIALILVGWFALVFLAIVIVVRKKFGPLPKRSLAEVEAPSGVPFELKYVAAEGRRLYVYLRYHLRSTKLSGSVSRGVSSLAGLACELRVDVDGQTVASEVIGHGSELPREVDRVVTMVYMSRTTWMGSDLSKKGTIRLAQVDHMPAGAELTVTGQVLLNESTSAPELTVFVSR